MVRAGDIGLLYWRELRSALRERNIVVNSILIPVLLYPTILWLVYTGISFVMGQTEGFSSRVYIQSLPQEHRPFQTELERDERIELRQSRDPVAEIRAGSLDLLMEFLPPEPGTGKIPGNFRLRLTFDGSKDRSGTAHTRLSAIWTRYRDRFLEAEAKQLGVTPAQLQQIWVESKNLATSDEMGQFLLGIMLPVFLIIMLCVGCMFPAIDCTAGEREKSTWETLMTVATARRNIVIAKYLYVATMCILAGTLNLLAMVLSMKAVLAPILGDRAEGFTFRIPYASIPVILLVTVLLALFISAGMMILASFARTFKEGQAMVSPFYVAIFLPVMFLQTPGVVFTPVMALIPVVNVAMVFREALGGIYHWHLIAITVISEAACIALALWLATLILRYEDFLIGSYGGNFGRFLKERLFARRLQGGKR